MSSGRWGGALTATLFLVALGLLYAEPRLLVATTIPLSYVVYDALSRVPEPALSAERTFDRADPAPGDVVTVTLAVHNEGDRVLPDVRVVDGVPDALAVVDGSPRACRSIRPGEAVAVTYDVVAKRGTYRFDDPAIRLRSLAAGDASSTTIEAGGEASLTGANAVADPPLSEATLRRAGTLPTDAGGSGLEFYATRQYQRGDPTKRIDWRRFARTGEFATVQYRQEQAVRTVIVLDARDVGRVTGQRGYPTGAELATYAGERLHDALERTGVVASLAAVGVAGEVPDGFVGPDDLLWVDADAHDGRQAPVRAAFDAVESAAADQERDGRPGPPPVDGHAVVEGDDRRAAVDGGHRADGTPRSASDGPDERVQRLLARLPPTAQVVCCTPLVDDWPLALAEALAVRNYPFVLVSPDVTGGDRTGGRVEGIRRSLRLRRLQHTDTTAVSWRLDQPIDVALRRSLPHLLERP